MWYKWPTSSNQDLTPIYPSHMELYWEMRRQEGERKSLKEKKIALMDEKNKVWSNKISAMSMLISNSAWFTASHFDPFNHILVTLLFNHIKIFCLCNIYRNCLFFLQDLKTTAKKVSDDSKRFETLSDDDDEDNEATESIQRMVDQAALSLEQVSNGSYAALLPACPARRKRRFACCRALFII